LDSAYILARGQAIDQWSSENGKKLTEAVHRAAELEQKKSPLKGNLSRITGVILKPLDNNKVFIRTEDGKERPYEVRPLVQQRLAKLSKDEAVVLFVDEANKVTDVAFIPKK
jgi:hypothetical protein